MKKFCTEVEIVRSLPVCVETVQNGLIGEPLTENAFLSWPRLGLVKAISKRGYFKYLWTRTLKTLNTNIKKVAIQSSDSVDVLYGVKSTFAFIERILLDIYVSRKKLLQLCVFHFSFHFIWLEFKSLFVETEFGKFRGVLIVLQRKLDAYRERNVFDASWNHLT